MLNLFRRRKSGLKWTLWIVIVALSGGMVLLFVDVPTGVGVALGDRHVAMVAGNRITVEEYRRSYSQLSEIYRRNFNLDPTNSLMGMQFGISQQALDLLINQYALRHGAQELGIDVSPEEVAEHIAAQPGFQENGVFIGTQRYKEILQANNLSVSEFEESVLRDIIGQKVQQVVTDGIQVTPEEIHREFLNRNQEIKLRYVLVDPEETKEGKVADADLRAYFEENRGAYMLPEKRRVKYIEVPLKPEEIQPNEDEILDRMASQPEKTRVRASHILISTEQRTDDEARTQAEEILNQVRQGTDFAGLAEKHSDDAGTRPEGGDLGFFQRGQMVPEFENVAFSLEPGEISDLVRTQFGYHIIKVTEAPKVDRRLLAETELRQEKAKNQALNLTTKMIYQAKAGTSLEALVQQYDLEIKETSFFTMGDVVSGLQVRSDFNRQIFSLESGQILDKPYESGQTYLVAELLEIQAAEPMAFENVKPLVLEDLRSARGNDMAQERAFALSKAAREKRSLEQAARDQRMKVVSTDFFKRNTSIDETLGSAEAVHNRAFQMKPGEISPALPVSDKYVVFEIAEKGQVDQEQFEQQKAQIGAQLNARKRTDFFVAWLSNLVRRLRQEEKIEINMELVDAITS
jgi:peptidyl-prolyl cis-trans isomerase D